MISPEFNYHAPKTSRQMCKLLEEFGENAAVLAGGTDLLVMMKQGQKLPEHVLSVRNIVSLRRISKAKDGCLVVGAGVPVRMIISDRNVSAKYAGLRDAASSMGTVHIRNRATVGGNIVSAAACGDFPPILVALDASVVLEDSSGSMSILMSEFFTDARKTQCKPSDLLTEIRIPYPENASGSCYEKYGYRRGARIAVASAAVNLVFDGEVVRRARIVLGAVAPVPLVAAEAEALLEGHPLTAGAIRLAAESAAKACRPISDIRGSEKYRREIVAVVSQKAIEVAAARAGRTVS